MADTPTVLDHAAESWESALARILVVEDDPDISNLVQLRLRGAGHRTLAASSAIEAIDAVAGNGRPDVVVLDVGLPDMDGLQLLRELRSRAGLAGLPAIFLSCRIEPGDVEAGRALGATYLTKPFVASALLNAVAHASPPVIAGGEW